MRFGEHNPTPSTKLRCFPMSSAMSGGPTPPNLLPQPECSKAARAERIAQPQAGAGCEQQRQARSQQCKRTSGRASLSPSLPPLLFPLPALSRLYQAQGPGRIVRHRRHMVCRSHERQEEIQIQKFWGLARFSQGI